LQGASFNERGEEKVWIKRPVLVSCRREEKTKERTKSAVSSRFFTRVQLKKNKKEQK